MSKRKNKKVIDRWNDEVFTKRNLEVMDELAHQDYAHTTAGVRGLDEAKKWIEDYFSAGKDFGTIEVIATVAEGDYVVQLRKNGVAVYRFLEGKILEDGWYSKPEIEK